MSDEIVRIIMCGSRTWKNETIIYDELMRLYSKYDKLMIDHGDEPNGADGIIHMACEEIEIPHKMWCAAKPRYTAHRSFKIEQVADWNINGNAAGPIRNKAMRDGAMWHHNSKLIGCVAFCATGKSNGTDGMLRLAADAGIPRIVYLDDGRRIIS